MSRWTCLALVGAALVTACGDGGDDNLRESLRCGSDGSCPEGRSCLVNECIRDGSLEVGETCMEEQQCAAGLTCHNFICKPGCSEFYTLDDCVEQTWCKPLADADPPAGSCAPSECDPASVEWCPDGSACVAFGDGIGGCLPYCEYGFASASYDDLCDDSPVLDLSCQPLGLNTVPICLPSGDPETAPDVGGPGCDAVRNPCRTGAICVDVVCRRQCLPNQALPCDPGESCVPHEERTDLYYCRAD